MITVDAFAKVIIAILLDKRAHIVNPRILYEVFINTGFTGDKRGIAMQPSLDASRLG
jgi:hypothetical protein